MTALQALEQAIKLAGGQTALAARITAIAHKEGFLAQNKQIKQQHINNWLNREKQCSARYALAVASAVDNKVTPNLLRPDFYPAESFSATT